MKISLNYKLLLKLGAIMGVANAAINLVLVWIIWQTNKAVPLWGPQSIASHWLGSAAVSGFVMCWVATKVTRDALRHNKVLPLHWHLKSQTLIDRLPSNIIARSFMLSLSSVLFAAYTIVLIDLKRAAGLQFDEYVVFTCIQAVCLAFGVTVMAVYRALGDNALQKEKLQLQ